MAISKKTVTICGCERCGHEWQPKDAATPTICPKCKSPYWNEKKALAPRSKKGAKTLLPRVKFEKPRTLTADMLPRIKVEKPRTLALKVKPLVEKHRTVIPIFRRAK